MGRRLPEKQSRNDPIRFSPYLYRAHNRVERFSNRSKQCRRVATRYDRLAADCLAFVQLPSIRRWLLLNEPAWQFDKHLHAECLLAVLGSELINFFALTIRS